MTVYAARKRCVLLTHDQGFSKHRRQNVVGRHIWLHCVEWDAADLLEQHLKEILPLVHAFNDVFIELSHNGWHASHQFKAEPPASTHSSVSPDYGDR